MHNPRSIFTAPDKFLREVTPRQESPTIRRSGSESATTAGDGGDGINSLDNTHSSGPIFPRHHSAKTHTTLATQPVNKNLLPGAHFKFPQKTLHSTEPLSNVPSTAGYKHSLDGQSETIVYTEGEKPRKRPRLGERSKHILEPFSFEGPSVNQITPPSPLFFSNSPNHPRPYFTPRLSSSEAGAKMLSNAQAEDSTIKKLTMARGSYAIGSPPLLRPQFSNRGSQERANQVSPVPPEGSGHSDQLRLLGQIGITELLEQDERPTFIVDLGDATNYQSGPLNLVFVNSALRAWDGILDQICGKAGEVQAHTSQLSDYKQFKTWLLGAAKNGESLNVCLPSFIRNGISWTCSTLRKRMRIVSGSPLLQPSESSSFFVSSPSGAFASTNTTKLISTQASTLDEDNHSATVRLEKGEARDYFGDAGLPSPPRIARWPTDTTSQSLLGSVLSPEWTYSPSVKQASDTNQLRNSTRVEATDQSEEVNIFDWTRLPITSNLPSHIHFARSFDWSSTSLGPIEKWSSDLRQLCNLTMASPYPAAMYWGKDLVAIYNEAYTLLAGQKHPKLMGQPYAEAWAEIWDDVKDVFLHAQTTGESTMKDDDCLFMYRNDFLEETYFSWSLIPTIGTDGLVTGFYNPAFEKTRRKIAERRMLTLREVGERTATARDVKGFWHEVLAALDVNEYDTPFVLLYSLSDESGESDDTSVHSSSLLGGKQCYLEGALGVPVGHGAAPELVDLKNGTQEFVPVFREVMKNNKPKVLHMNSGDIQPDLLEGMDCRGFGDPVKSVVVCPIHPTTGEFSLGFLVIGVNPRRPYDDDYDLFIQLLSRQLATSLASVVLFEEEIRRGQKAAKLAAQDRIQLSEQLAARTQEAIESETKFTRMAEFAPVGMFIANSRGVITYCNDTWLEISRVPKVRHCTDRWIEFVMDEDRSLVEQLWHDLVVNAKPATAEFRFKAPWIDGNGTMGETWVLFSAYPEKTDEGTLKSIFGSITGISQQKWAEGFQKRKMEEAVELKRQQENFIDITSHEMRNPLSAILQCSDEIISSLTEARARHGAIPNKILYDDNIDAAQTISLCAQHQKRIVDDVLTLSKLDSALIMVTPIDVQPLTVVQRALKMFESEVQTADILVKLIVDESFTKLKVDWVRLDPSRVLQVLINLTTNAIKFTTSEKKRTITITASASRRKPSADEHGIVKYFPSRSKQADIMQGPDWGTGEEIYLHFAVQDTGRGLNDEEKKLLFLRFSQASPRTHIQYGGSGLGLFISRELTELQGGEIGVASEAGKGSTFAFFVKARRSTAPSSPVQQLPMPGGRKNMDSKVDASDPSLPKPRDFATVPPAREKKPIKVLVVEDNLVNQRVLQKQLMNIGCVVHVANHGGEALDQLRESWFWNSKEKKSLELSVVLMDQEMPVMDGLTCTRTIRQLEQEGKLLGHVPIIAVTANARNEQIQTAIEAGMDDVVSKPFRIPDLLPKIEELLAKYPEPTAPP